jgi:hypothetical protein
VSPRYRHAYNAAPTILRPVLIVLGDIWAALAIGTRFDR